MDFLLREKIGKKNNQTRNIHTLKNKTGSQIEIYHSFPDVEKKSERWPLLVASQKRVHLGIPDADSDSENEAADMDCMDQEMNFSAQLTLGKMNDITSH
ncbi:hypothetical protein AVEN_190420-1 [Araneus ventricosus]|uniref:Uncharacterized protein n=1 Tax=Araneus ventricosus TaxID=182803 RepID=A0A4Y2WGI3_ARAVE|nr:hypothetical protein AVEN_190420-1 [Araneus ventricosus]